jgi:hypothetical protein
VKIVLHFGGTCDGSRRNGAGTISFWTLRRLRADKDESHGRRHDEVRMRVARDENEPGAAIGHGEIGRLSAISGNRRHGDMKELAERLVQVLQPQPWPDLGRAELEAKLPSARVDIGERRALLEAEVGDREDNEASITPDLAEVECGAAENLVCPVSDLDALGVQCVTKRIDGLLGAESDRPPDRNVCGGFAAERGNPRTRMELDRRSGCHRQINALGTDRPQLVRTRDCRECQHRCRDDNHVTNTAHDCFLRQEPLGFVPT